MNKKAQVTLVIIIGIVLMSAVAVSFSIYSSTKKLSVERASQVPVEAQPVKNYVDTCLKQASSDGINLLGLQGGRIYLPDDYAITAYSNVNYAFVEENITLPSTAFMESDLSEYVKNNIDSCIDNFNPFRQQGYDVFAGMPVVSTQVLDSAVVVSLTYPIKLSKAESIVTLSDFILTVPVRLGHIHSVVSSILQETKKNPDRISASSLLKYDVNITIIPIDSSSILYYVTDVKSEADNKAYTFLFAVKYKLNNPPEILMPDKLNLVDSAAVNIKLNVFDADGDVMAYSDDTAMFDVSRDGLISFTPEVVGVFNVTFIVEDSHGASASKTIEFNVIPKNHNPELFAFDVVCSVGVECSGQFFASDADNDKLFFSSNAPYISLNSGTGVFKFVPAQKGKSAVKVSVTDGSFTDTQDIILEIR